MSHDEFKSEVLIILRRIRINLVLIGGYEMILFYIQIFMIMGEFALGSIGAVTVMRWIVQFVELCSKQGKR